MGEKTVVVTGGTVRIGAAIAKRLKSDGWRVITVSHRSDSGADVIADFREPSGAVKAYAAVLQLTGGRPPDALVNNAAIFTGESADILAVNFVAAEKLIMLMAGREVEERAAIVNILDARAREGDYGESKQKLREYTVKAAMMFADTLRVNSVSPGAVLAPTSVREAAGETLIGRPTPESVADAVAFFLSNESVTGVDLPVDCGDLSRFERLVP